jgi:hypothetical protein
MPFADQETFYRRVDELLRTSGSETRDEFSELLTKQIREDPDFREAYIARSLPILRARIIQTAARRTEQQAYAEYLAARREQGL